MMKNTHTTITQVKCWKENLGLKRPYTVTYRTVDSTENLFVYLETGEGLYGIGSGSPSEYVTGENLEDSLAELQANLESLLLGKDIRQFQFLIREMEKHFIARPAAMAAIDVALHDLFCKYLDISLVDYFGRAHETLPTSMTIGIKSLEETLADGIEFKATGFKIIKLKIGRNIDEDIERLTKLRETVGKEMLIRVDANQGYSLEEAQRFFKETAPYDVEFVEQPFTPGNMDLMMKLPKSIRKRCAADEDLHSPFQAIVMAHPPQPYGIYNIKLMKCGGILKARQLAQIAEHSSIDLMWGCNDESAVSITASLHIALASPATKYLDLDGSLDLATDVVKGGFVLKDGYMHLTGGPGLGVELLK
ncbi:MAG: dipeptide epimerase [Microscillaceae bacterium]|nr:dipeptide epimerase [Microscillaceae bacterium]